MENARGSERIDGRGRQRIKGGEETLVAYYLAWRSHVATLTYLHIGWLSRTRQGHYRIITFHTYRATTMMAPACELRPSLSLNLSLGPARSRERVYTPTRCEAGGAADRAHTRARSRATRPTRLPRNRGPMRVCAPLACTHTHEELARSRVGRLGGSRVNYRLDRILRCFVVFQRAERK